MNNPQDIAVLERLINALDKLSIAYVVGGSMASSAYGQVRFTQDADITAEPFDTKADKLFGILKDDFYISKEAMFQALSNQSSFNVIHLKTAFKIDIFIRQNNEFQKQMLLRGRKLKLQESSKAFVFVSPEDIILLKLDWYKQSDCTSERQLTDVLGVLGVQKDNLDFVYLKNWAKKLSLNELLEKTISDSKR